MTDRTKTTLLRVERAATVPLVWAALILATAFDLWLIAGIVAAVK